MASTAIGIRCFGNICSQFFDSFVNFLQQNKTSDTTLLPIIYDLPYHVAANQIVKCFKNTNCDNLMFIDSDVVFTYQHFLDLKIAMDNPINKDYGAISGLLTSRRSKIVPLALQKNENGEYIYDDSKLINEGITDVKGTGLGFVQIRRKCFELPCFKDDLWFQFVGNGGEDIFFFEGIIAGGYKVGVSSKILIGHSGQFNIFWNVKESKADIYTTDCFNKTING